MEENLVYQRKQNCKIFASQEDEGGKGEGYQCALLSDKDFPSWPPPSLLSSPIFSGASPKPPMTYPPPPGLHRYAVGVGAEPLAVGNNGPTAHDQSGELLLEAPSGIGL